MVPGDHKPCDTSSNYSPGKNKLHITRPIKDLAWPLISIGATCACERSTDPEPRESQLSWQMPWICQPLQSSLFPPWWGNTETYHKICENWKAKRAHHTFNRTLSSAGSGTACDTSWSWWERRTRDKPTPTIHKCIFLPRKSKFISKCFML